MKALVKRARGVGNIALLDAPAPAVGPHDVLIEVAAAGVCGTDVLIAQDKVSIYRPPVILGHNVAGTVAAVGAEVQGFSPGDRVAVDMNVGACGRCAYCLSKREYLCPSRKGLGYGIDGGMAEALSVDERWLVKVPAGVPLVEAAIMDFCNAVHSLVDRADVRKGSSVAIMGPGFQGLAMVQVARLLGASPVLLVGLQRHRARLALAERLGADQVVMSDEQDLPAAAQEVTNGEGFDVVLETTGSSKALGQALAIVRRGGCLTALGSLPADAEVDMHRVVYDEVSVNGVRGYNRENVRFFLSALAAHQLDVGSLIQAFPLDSWEEAFDARAQRQVIEPVLIP
ncbi:MAG: zinc-dependent alcohol dehydrogenase [Chloroflexota bacterium]